MSAFSSEVLTELNKFRSNPQSVGNRLVIFRRGLSRLKANDPFLTEIDKFVASLPKIQPLMSFELNPALCEAAQNQLPFLSVDPENFKKIQQGDELNKIVPKIYMKEEPILIADDGSESAENVVNKLLLNKGDRYKIGRNTLTSDRFTQVGIASTIKDGEHYCIVIFALKKAKKRSEMPLPPGDLSELKQAFDLFDTQKEGEISPKETLEAMKSLGYDKKNPELYRIMYLLDTPENTTVDFPLFANHIISMITNKTSDDGIRTIFNLFVDDPKEDTISILNLKKIIEELGEKISKEEIDKLLMMKGAANAKLTYDEFYDYMRRTYGMGEERTEVYNPSSYTTVKTNMYTTSTKNTTTRTTTSITTTVRSGGYEKTSKIVSVSQNSG